MSYNIKSIRDEFKAKGIFYTQPELALYLKSLIDVPIVDAYDPTCGDGSLLACFPDELPKYGQEINDHQLKVAQERLVNFIGVCADTLREPAFMDRKFSCIVANPPFSISWDPPMGLFADARFADIPAMPPKSKADYAFLLHIMHLLADDGIAVVLNFPGILYRGQSEGALRKWFVTNNWIDKVVHIAGKTFVDTSIATAALVLRKNKTTTDIQFVNSELNLSRIVSVSEIEKNQFNLSVGQYVQKVEPKEHIDSLALNQKARTGMIRKLLADIAVDQMICELEGWDFKCYLDELADAILNYPNHLPAPTVSGEQQP